MSELTKALKRNTPNNEPIPQHYSDALADYEVTKGKDGNLYVSIQEILAGNNNIGNVDIVTMPNVTLGASTNNIGDVDILSSPQVSTTGSAVPTKASMVAGTDGTNLRALKTDSSGELQVDVLTLPNVTIGAALPAGSAIIGKVGIDQTAGQNIVSVSSMPSATWTVTQDSSANASQTLTKDGVAAQRHYITKLSVYTSAASTTPDVSIVLNDNAVAKEKYIIGAGASRGSNVNILFNPPLQCGINTQITLVVGSAGTGCITVGNICGFTQ